jgi:ABC-type nitrate/sulfonate/bicarbonate transport system substrate-binding protein
MRVSGSLNRREFLRRTAAVSAGLALTAGRVLPANAAPEVEKVEMWAVRDPQQGAAVTLAALKGYFKDEGIDLTLKYIIQGVDLPSLMASGEISFATEAVTTTAILRDRGVDVRYLMQTALTAGTQCFVLGPNLKLTSPKDLEGKKIGMAAGSGVGLAIRNVARHYAVDYSKLIFVNLQAPDQAPALARGDIDAMAVWQPWALVGVSMGGKLYFTGNKSYIDGVEKPANWEYLDGGLNVSGAFIDKNPNTVKAVIRAILKAIKFINDNPIEVSANILKDTLNIPVGDLSTMMTQNIYSATIDNAVLAGATELLQYGADPAIKWYDKPYKPTELWDLRLLKEVSPGSVTANGV